VFYTSRVCTHLSHSALNQVQTTHRISGADLERVERTELKVGDEVLVEVGQIIPADGEVVSGTSLVDESAITGESAPVVREPGSDRSAVTAGTRIMTNALQIRVTSVVGGGLLSQATHLLSKPIPHRVIQNASMAAAYVAAGSLLTFVGISHERINTMAIVISITLTPLWCVPDILNLVGVTYMIGLIRKNILPKDARILERAAQVDTLILDKTGTLTAGDRRAIAFEPLPGVTHEELAAAAQLASLSDETPEGRSIVILAKDCYQLRSQRILGREAVFTSFSADTQMSGVRLFDPEGDSVQAIFKGSVQAITDYVRNLGGTIPRNLAEFVNRISEQGGTPLLVVDGSEILGAVHLTSTARSRLGYQFHRIQSENIQTVIMTGDRIESASPLAKSIGIQEIIANASPATKLKFVREQQQHHRHVAFVGDGNNDAPALAQADIGVVLNSGTQTARSAGNVLALNNDPLSVVTLIQTAKQFSARVEAINTSARVTALGLFALTYLLV
jgi:K+-transporting ATPase ATPase B chain